MKKLAKLILPTCCFFCLTACNCPEIDPYHELTNITIDLLDADGTPIAKNNYSKDTLFLQLTLGSRFISQTTSFTFQDIFPSAMATQKCPTDGSYGFKVGMDSLVFSTDYILDSLPAGSDLKDKITYDNQPMSYWLEAINQAGHIAFQSNNQFYIFKLIRQLGQSGTFTFKAELFTEDGGYFYDLSTALQWY